MEKMVHVEQQQSYENKEKIIQLNDTVHQLEGDIQGYKFSADQLECELENLLKINDMYQDTIKELKNVIEKKDRIISDHLHTIAKLTEGSARELEDIKLVFFSKSKDLVTKI